MLLTWTIIVLFVIKLGGTDGWWILLVVGNAGKMLLVGDCWESGGGRGRRKVEIREK